LSSQNWSEVTRLDRYILEFNSRIKQALENNFDKFYLLDQLITLINSEINLENPHPTTVRKACIATYDYCELKNDWFFWENWASRAGVLECDDSGIIYAGLGRVSEEKGDLDLSLEQHKNGCNLKYEKKIGIKGLGLNHHGLGIVYMRQRDFRTFDHLNKAIKIFRKLKNPYHLGCACCDLGGAYYWRLYFLRTTTEKPRCLSLVFEYFRNVIKSIWFYLEAIYIHKTHGFKWDLGRMYYSFGITIMEAIPLRRAAKAIFNKAIKWGKSTNSQRYVALSHYGLGWYFYRRRKYFLARKELVTAHNMYSKIIMDTNRPYYLENEFNISSLLCQTYLKLNEVNLFMQQFESIWSTFINNQYHNQEIAKKREVILHIAKKANLQKKVELLSSSVNI